jgi:hypothetical protein
MNTDLGKYQNRAKKYWFIDGLAEIGFGLICIWLALLFSIENLYDQTPFRDLSFFILAFLGALAVRLLIQRLKEHSTYPRTGYLSYKQGKGEQKDGPNFSCVHSRLAFTTALHALEQCPSRGSRSFGRRANLCLYLYDVCLPFVGFPVPTFRNP